MPVVYDGTLRGVEAGTPLHQRRLERSGAYLIQRDDRIPLTNHRFSVAAPH